MGKMIDRAQKNGAATKRRLAQLRRAGKQLAARLSKLDADISKLSETAAPALSDAAFEQWLEEMSGGLPNLPPLPLDFGRASLYDDHD